MPSTMPPTDALIAADQFRTSVLSRADADHAGAPLWHGWVIVEAYLAGQKAEREACAALIDRQAAMLRNMFDGRHDALCRDLAAAIRNRE